MSYLCIMLFEEMSMKAKRTHDSKNYFLLCNAILQVYHKITRVGLKCSSTVIQMQEKDIFKSGQLRPNLVNTRTNVMCVSEEDKTTGPLRYIEDWTIRNCAK